MTNRFMPMDGNPAADDRAGPHVVVVGAGFGCLEAAKTLGRAPVRLTVIDQRNHHLFHPLPYQVASATLSPADIAAPIRQILKRQANTEVLLAEVGAVDLDARKVRFEDGGELDYDFLLLATGASHSYSGHDAWAKFAPGLKSLEDACEIRRRFLLTFEQAEREPGPEARRALLTYVVVGGGATGVELDRAGRVIVASDLSVPGHPEVFVIGDLASFSHGVETPPPGVAPVAVQQGREAGPLGSSEAIPRAATSNRTMATNLVTRARARARVRFRPTAPAARSAARAWKTAASRAEHRNSSRKPAAPSPPAWEKMTSPAAPKPMASAAVRPTNRPRHWPTRMDWRPTGCERRRSAAPRSGARDMTPISSEERGVHGQGNQLSKGLAARTLT